LLNGASLVIFPAYSPSLEELGHFVEEQRITTLWLTSRLFQQMVDGPIDSLRQVRQLLAGGDVLPATHVRKALEKLKGCELINGYGPTENTTFTCCFRMTSPSQAGESVPIGRPISNTHVYILDRYLQPVPIGVPGELFTGGGGLARGYLHEPKLTAERFVPDPFSSRPDARLYRTGDLARFRSDSNIEFLGRLDQQVKIRGYRIELGEIEALLCNAPRVSQVAVVARQSPDGDRSLVAYVVEDHSNNGEAHTNGDFTGELRQYVQRSLPEFMVPSRFIHVESLPLNANGKVDRRALPEPETATLNRKESVSPRTEVERALASIWEDVLQVQKLGIHDHFFADLGGHSLRATQLVSRLREAFEVELPLRTIFEAPTIAELAFVIEDRLLSEVEQQNGATVEALIE
jgi:aspartate racemase